MSSSDPAIAIRSLGKRYTIHHDYTAPTTLAEAIARRVRHPLGRTEREHFWALRDVTFDVREGEVLGIVGGNGAGKSTLLKILSRITEMTEGEVDLYGRVGSLLEVGTGFNQELTGRENVYLNGAILGMTRAEIQAQFDQIVDFSGVERFLDTTVKHYSSGMYVRLAFAVAAHLRTEILIVDEVLAVGDRDFQRKCLGKMRNVASQGRTVLLVSHNMSVISNLCSRAIVLKSGRLVFAGDVPGAVAEYSSGANTLLVSDLRLRRDRAGSGEIRAVGLLIRDARGHVLNAIRPSEPFELIVEYESRCRLTGVGVSIDVEQMDGTRLATLYSAFRDETFSVAAGRGAFSCRIAGLPLRPDTYSLNVFIGGPHAMYDFVERAMPVEIALADCYGTGRLPDRTQGPLISDYHWAECGAEMLEAAPSRP